MNQRDRSISAWLNAPKPPSITVRQQINHSGIMISYEPSPNLQVVECITHLELLKARHWRLMVAHRLSRMRALIQAAREETMS